MTEIEALPLAKFSLQDAAIATMAQQYGTLTINGVEDTEGFKAVHAARMVVKDHRVKVEKVRKELKADALEWGRKVDAEAKRITLLLEPIEGHLTKQEDVYEEAKEAIRNAARLKAEAEAKARADAEAARIKAEQEAEAARVKAIQDAENERLRVEREKIEAERAAFEAEKAKAAAEAKAAQDKIDADRRAVEAEQKRLADEEAARLRAVDMEKAKAEAAEKSRIETEARIAREEAEKEAAEKARVAAEEAARIKAEELRPDREKLMQIVQEVGRIKLPSMATNEGETAAYKITEILDTAEEEIREIVSKL